MNGAVFAYSRRGCSTARRLAALFGAELYCAARLEEPDFTPIPQPSRPFYGQQFAQREALIFVGACGIAVRQIGPFAGDKTRDPAVLAVDELGKFVIPLLSGHIGGANALARTAAEALGAQAVITTATDINGKFSVDAWAAQNGFAISSMALAKAVSAAILERQIPLYTQLPVRGAYPGGVIPGDRGELGIYVGYTCRNPFEKTLHIIPPMLRLGIGCRRGTPEAEIARTVDRVLEEHGIFRQAICCVCSIDLKREEQGLLDFCAHRALPAKFYSAQELSRVPGQFSASEFVARTTGVDNVCERAACLGADRLIVKKTACSGVTVAVAAEHREVNFGETQCGGHWPRGL